MCVCVYLCVCVCVFVCLSVCVCVCVHARAYKLEQQKNRHLMEVNFFIKKIIVLCLIKRSFGSLVMDSDVESEQSFNYIYVYL